MTSPRELRPDIKAWAINELTERQERAVRSVARLDAWLNATPEDHPDWEFQYRALRQARRRIRRCHLAAHRIEETICGDEVQPWRS